MWAGWASVFMFVAVAMGAFGAHALKTRFSPDVLNIFETGVRYQVYHALGLFVVSWLASRQATSLLNSAGVAFTIGIVLFSGSLYLLCLTGARWWGAVTPLGGLAFLIGWALLAIHSFRS
jgi:uncharacterized membrane protein YgdD (TMEM256/DUF423 family)